MVDGSSLVDAPPMLHGMSSGQQDKRQYRRHAWRLPCTFRAASGDERGFVTNVSARGFFIQTRSPFEPGADILVTIESGSTPPIVVTGVAARQRKAHRSMSSLEQPGIGVQIESAPEDYYALVFELEGRQ